MVDFLLQNSLGAWWVSTFLDKPLPVEMPYLRFVNEVAKNGETEAVRRPATGGFEAWPPSLKEFKLLDPCCGSGHFLAAALLILVPMRMRLEGLNARDAVDAVLRDNLYGVELDPRCVEIAVFALALAAWTYPGTDGYRPLPRIHVACCRLAFTEKGLGRLRLATSDERLRAGITVLCETFKDAPVLGSLIDPWREAKGDLVSVDYEELAPLLDAVLRKEMMLEDDATIAAQGLAEAAAILAGRYDLIITNPPYLAGGKHDDTLKGFCERYYPFAKNDLANVFLERALEGCKPGGGRAVRHAAELVVLKELQKTARASAQGCDLESDDSARGGRVR